MAALCGAAFFC